MADNGRAPSFNDRRGQNPFQPVAVKRATPRTEFSRPERQVDSYIGKGNAGPNAKALPKYFNGATQSRVNPDQLHTFDTERRLGRSK